MLTRNWTYNPTQHENNEVPMSVMFKDLLTTYKLGWKTSYYQNTYDYKTDSSVEVEVAPVQNAAEEFKDITIEPQSNADVITNTVENDTAEDCDACAI